MERVRSMTLGSICLVLVSLTIGSGCAGTKSSLASLMNKKTTVPPSPAAEPVPVQTLKMVEDGKPGDKGVNATEFACAWKTRLEQLPDPTRNGQLTPGIVGQVFLYTQDMKPADVHGDLTVMVSDATSRPQGAYFAKPEVWHITADVLSRMVVKDERFGRSVAVFLPWPPEWRDVNRLNIQCAYAQPGTHKLYAQPTKVTLDFSEMSPGQPSVSPGSMQQGMSSIPDPNVVLKQTLTPINSAVAGNNRPINPGMPAGQQFPQMAGQQQMPSSMPSQGMQWPQQPQQGQQMPNQSPIQQTGGVAPQWNNGPAMAFPQGNGMNGMNGMNAATANFPPPQMNGNGMVGMPVGNQAPMGNPAMSQQPMFPQQQQQPMLPQQQQPMYPQQQQMQLPPRGNPVAVPQTGGQPQAASPPGDMRFVIPRSQ